VDAVVHRRRSRLVRPVGVQVLAAQQGERAESVEDKAGHAKVTSHAVCPLVAYSGDDATRPARRHESAVLRHGLAEPRGGVKEVWDEVGR
jgi:hypothetical protein